MEVIRIAAHGDKLRALLANSKLPAADRGRVEHTVTKYEAWIKALNEAKGESPAALLKALVDELNAYKRHIELDLIFDAD